MAIQDKKAVLAWALYDWANSAFATTVMAAFFPIFFQRYWGELSEPAVSTFRLGMASALASIVVAASAPFLGAIADRVGGKKRFLAVFAAVGVAATMLLFFVPMGSWAWASSLFVLATIGFAGGNIFYDSLIVSVCDDEQVDLVSAVGFSVGYLGGGVLLGINAWMVNQPATFGLEDASAAVRWSFLSVALWWGAFAVPLFLVVREPPGQGEVGVAAALRLGWVQLRATFKKLRQLRVVATFLLGYWFYIDGVDTVIRMATDYGARLNLDAGDMIKALLVTQFVGFPAAIVFGWVGGKVGAKRGIFAGIVAYVGITAYGAFVDSAADFMGLAICVGLVQGGVQSLSRSLFTRLIPTSQAAEFFGFYNMLGKFAAVIGPALMAVVSLATDNPRVPLLSIISLFVVGGAILLRVDEARGVAMARDLEAGGSAP